MASIINAALSGGLTTSADTSGILQLQTASTTAVTVTASQNVGIGTTSPTSFGGFKTLELANSSGDAISLVTGTSVISQTISSNTNSLVYMGSRSNHPLVLTTNDTERARIDTSGNLGLGVTPSAWFSGVKVIQFGTAGVLFSNSDRANLASNLYVDSGTNSRYISNGFALRYAQEVGEHVWSSAPSGTAGNLATLTRVLAVEKDKSLALQGAVQQTGTGITFPATQSASSNANTLDDYEEGTWTPTAGTFTVIGTFTGTGTYVKIGSQVTVTARLNATTSIACTAGQYFDSLPFTPSGSVGVVYVGGSVNDNINEGGSTYTGASSTRVYSAVAFTPRPDLFFTITYFA